MVRNNAKRSSKNKIMNVRVANDYAGEDGLYVDRCISELQNSHSQITMLLEDSFSVNANTTAINGILAGPQIFLFDDFVSIAQQFETFRIRGVRFDIYDVAPGSTVNGWFSTFHSEFLGSAQPVYTLANVIDGPDSQLVPPGVGKVTLYWRAKGANENRFVTDDDANVTNPPTYFGGLRYTVAAVATAFTKYTIVVKALVDFRGRI